MKILIAFIIVILSSAAYATSTYECTYSSFSDEKGNHKENFSLIFLMDKSTGKTYLIGNNGSSEVIHIDRGIGQSFIEITEIGSVLTTTIDQNMKSVHSRNTVNLTGELIPTQYYGACRKK